MASMLTFFSGFGLGTILTPVLAIFFPIELAIAATGVVHFINNIFKIVLVGKNTDKAVLIRFGLPAILASFAGALLLIRITGLPALLNYNLFGGEFEVTPVKLIISVLLIMFSAVELLPSVSKIQFDKNKLAMGGLLSGFFGGLSGIQGAVRSAFLIRAGLSKEAFIATGVAIACLIDLTRLTVYATRFGSVSIKDNLLLITTATIAALAGALAGNKLLRKVTLRFVQVVVAIMLFIVALALGSGLI